MEQPTSRRRFIATVTAGAAALSMSDVARAYPVGQPTLERVATSPQHLWNAVTLTASGGMFAGMPRWPGFTDTPSVVEILKDGSLKPYPGGGYESWAPGKDPSDAFVCVNTVHCFDGRHLWILDVGAIPLDPPLGTKGAQKLVAVDTLTDRIVKTYTFDDLLTPDANLNDLRIGGGKIYLTESGLGSIVVIDIASGKMLHRLANASSTKADPNRPKLGRDDQPMILPDGKPQMTNADPIELSPDHRWLYYAPASGPLYRVPTTALNDPSVSEDRLASMVEYVFDMPTVGGTAMDTRGNLYFAESARPRVSVLSPDGAVRTIVEDDRIWGGDALFISKDRYLYIPLSQLPDLPFAHGPGGKDTTTRPFKIFRVKLDTRYGNALTA